MLTRRCKLPYEHTALEPYISRETVLFHYDKHHAAYAVKLESLIRGTRYEKMELESIIDAARRNGDIDVLNNAAQVWNHTFYWHSMQPNGGGAPSGALADAINAAFGSFDEFKQKFSTSAATNFGSGWTWLVKNGDGSVEIVNTSNAGNPMTDGKTPLLTIDVWEHAYYIDFRNARPKYLEEIWKLINWDFVAGNFAG